ncbi:hypothetical protein BpHYR1_009389 [Brachionus plicatilis]|uniref:Uncharacterized protein n=1 Tax=Brachionus plicatilis TaxID=10195 RepID=A0A3M7RTL6_BRAPC|nr:hypothetical protein BpHYR1_009389 [Brachionus plicatilis]
MYILTFVGFPANCFLKIFNGNLSKLSYLSNSSLLYLELIPVEIALASSAFKISVGFLVLLRNVANNLEELTMIKLINHIRKQLFSKYSSSSSYVSTWIDSLKELSALNSLILSVAFWCLSFTTVQPSASGSYLSDTTEFVSISEAVSRATSLLFVLIFWLCF